MRLLIAGLAVVGVCAIVVAFWAGRETAASPRVSGTAAAGPMYSNDEVAMLVHTQAQRPACDTSFSQILGKCIVDSCRPVMYHSSTRLWTVYCGSEGQSQAPDAFTFSEVTGKLVK